MHYIIANPKAGLCLSSKILCLHVSMRIECNSSAGVQMIRVGLLSEKADIKYNPSLITPDELVSSIKSLGYGASVINIFNVNDGKLELMV